MIFLLWAWVSIAAFGEAKQSILTGQELQVLKKKPCTLVHVWATWCDVCTKEMPQLLGALKSLKKVNPVIIDVSSPSLQDSISKRWMASLNPPFETYLKPDVDDSQYMDAVDKSWDGALPFSVLFDKGKKKRKPWVGALPLEELKNEVKRLCRF